MLDQASELRKLVIRSVKQQITASGPAPGLIVVAAGKAGVGATTTAVNLSVAMAEQGLRVVIVDTDLMSSRVATLCDLADTQGVGEVMFARRDIHEVLQRGPAGIQVVAGRFNRGPADPDTQWTDIARQRLARQLNTLGRHADVVVLDAGGGSNRFLASSQAADHFLLVTTVENESVMDTYACIKTTLGNPARRRWELVVNQCDDPAVGRDVHRRIDQSCRRFLDQEIALAATIPVDPCVARAEAAAVPLVISHPSSPATAELTRLAAALARNGARRTDTKRNAA